MPDFFEISVETHRNSRLLLDTKPPCRLFCVVTTSKPRTVDIVNQSTFQETHQNHGQPGDSWHPSVIIALTDILGLLLCWHNQHYVIHHSPADWTGRFYWRLHLISGHGAIFQGGEMGNIYYQVFGKVLSAFFQPSQNKHQIWVSFSTIFRKETVVVPYPWGYVYQDP